MEKVVILHGLNTKQDKGIISWVQLLYGSYVVESLILNSCMWKYLVVNFRAKIFNLDCSCECGEQRKLIMERRNERMRTRWLGMNTRKMGVCHVALLFVCLKMFSLKNEKEIYIWGKDGTISLFFRQMVRTCLFFYATLYISFMLEMFHNINL